jgi:Saccharopine dehydrogenase C-terminal domain
MTFGDHGSNLCALILSLSLSLLWNFLVSHYREARLRSFESFAGGLVAPESDDNPWRYKFTWNPRNVVLAGMFYVESTFAHVRLYIYVCKHTRSHTRTHMSIHTHTHLHMHAYMFAPTHTCV